MTDLEAKAEIRKLFPDGAKRRINPNKVRQAFDLIISSGLVEVEASRQRVMTFAEMLPFCIVDKPKTFRVDTDETLGNQRHVFYTWDGEILFMYDMYPSSTQPNT